MADAGEENGDSAGEGFAGTGKLSLLTN